MPTRSDVTEPGSLFVGMRTLRRWRDLGLAVGLGLAVVGAAGAQVSPPPGQPAGNPMPAAPASDPPGTPAVPKSDPPATPAADPAKADPAKSDPAGDPANSDPATAHPANND